MVYVINSIDHEVRYYYYPPLIDEETERQRYEQNRTLSHSSSLRELLWELRCFSCRLCAYSLSS